MAALALLLLAAPAGAQTTVDYDTDDDRLIEIDSPAKLNAIRYDVDGDGTVAAGDQTNYDGGFANALSTQCPGGCQGYELTADLDLSTDYPTWTPIGTSAARFRTTFDGNGHTISGLTVSSGINVGLFGNMEVSGGTSGVIRNLGVLGANVTATVATSGAGAIVGSMRSGALLHSSYAVGGTITAAANGASIGGLAGANVGGAIRASYSTNTVTISGARDNNHLGGLAGTSSGTIAASYAAGPVSGTGGAGNNYGGLVGRSTSAGSTITNSYCDATVHSGNCIGISLDSATATAAGYATRELRRPTAYAGTIYADWNIDLSNPADGVGDDPWDFGTRRNYPLLKIDKDGDGEATCLEFGGQPCYVYIPPEPPPYNPAHDHPEIYENARYEMATSCAVQTTGTGDEAKSTSTLTFDLGSYTRPITLALSLWDGTHFRSLQSQNIAMPELGQEGQTATVEVATNPAQTRFRLDSEYGLNLVLGYADCHTDDP